MKRYRLKAALESPLVIRRERQSQRSEGASFISGTLVRGAVAQIYLQQRGEADETFQKLFLDESTCRFGPLDPGERVFPLTAYSCKRRPGFNDHGVVDLLSALLRPRFGRPAASPERCSASGCGHDLKGHTGFWGFEDGNPSEPARRWRRNMAAHVGIDRYTHTAAHAIFFSLPALEPELVENKDELVELQGWVEAEDEIFQQVTNVLRDADGIARIGHARTRGYGRVKLTLGDQLSTTSHDWNQWSAVMLAKIGNKLDPERHFLFTVSLPTGAVLVDETLRYTLDPSGMVSWLPPLPPADPEDETLNREGKPFEGGTLWCVTAVAQHERLRGWNAAHGLPRQDESVVTRGSVYAYLYQGDDAGRTALQERLRQLSQHGIGARRNEGFGRVIICDDFHTRFAPEEVT